VGLGGWFALGTGELHEEGKLYGEVELHGEANCSGRGSYKGRVSYRGASSTARARSRGRGRGTFMVDKGGFTRGRRFTIDRGSLAIDRGRTERSLAIHNRWAIQWHIHNRRSDSRSFRGSQPSTI
jgi:hypothetical protein